VGAESSGVPVPGETALIAGAVLAQRGKLSIEAVIAIAAAAAIVGDNIGYFVSRRVGRGLLERPGPLHARRLAFLERGDRFFARHGSKAVFFGRWILGLRVWASWMAGISGMRWRTFLLWNALGGISWAVSIGLLAYWVGKAAAHLFAAVGASVALVVIVVAAGIWLWLSRRADRLA
jgi:membrane-associated protein